MTRFVILGAAVVALVAAAAFGATRLAAPAGPPPVAAAPGPEDDRGHVERPLADEPLVRVRGSVPGTTLGLLSLHRAGPKVLVVRVRVSARRSADEWETRSMHLDRPESATYDASGLELRDAATGRATRPALTPGRECDCSPFDGIDPGQAADVGATFRMPTAEGPFVLRVPGFPEIAGIEPAGG